MRRLLLIGLGLVGCASPQPPSPFAGTGSGPVLLAHRGLAQTFDLAGVGNDTCTASRIHPPTHVYLENTLPSIGASIAAGADVVEIDLQPTRDGHFVVFHDWILDCRTDGQGVTRSHSLAELKQLDIGYGYTADGGDSYPFRGQGRGAMPSLEEVLQAFPNQALLLNVKSADANEGQLLADFLAGIPPEQRRYLAVYGDQRPIAVVRGRLPDVLTMSRDTLQSCLLGTLALGWSGWLPASCERSLILIPLNYAARLPGWPEPLVTRMRAIGSAVFVVGDYGGGLTAGIDTVADVSRLPQGFTGGIWTNEIQLLGATLHK